MNKILILTYFFPPSNFAGSYRVASFAKYLHKYGYYPIVVTRQAPENAGNFREMAKDCGKDTIHQKHEGYEVYYLPYKGNLRDRIYSKYGDSKFVFARKILSFFELIFQGVSPVVLPYSNLYYFAKSYLKKNKDVKLLLCSGKPFQLFFFAHLLHKKFGIKWVADYRDEWNTRYINNNFKIRTNKRIYFLIEVVFEKKWIKSASVITTVTEIWKNKISNCINKKTEVVLNGYDINTEKYYKIQSQKAHNESLTIIHLGSLYERQPIECFIRKIVELLKQKVMIKCYFPGVTNNAINAKRIINSAGIFMEHFVILPRIEQGKVFELMSNADAFLMVGYQDFSGWMSQKVLEYFPWHKPIILYPYNELLENLLKPYSKSYICQTEECLEAALIEIYKNRNNIKINESDEAYIKRFTREKQVEILSEKLNRLQ